MAAVMLFYIQYKTPTSNADRDRPRSHRSLISQGGGAGAKARGVPGARAVWRLYGTGGGGGGVGGEAALVAGSGAREELLELGDAALGGRAPPGELLAGDGRGRVPAALEKVALLATGQSCAEAFELRLEARDALGLFFLCAGWGHSCPGLRVVHCVRVPEVSQIWTLWEQ